MVAWHASHLGQWPILTALLIINRGNPKYHYVLQYVIVVISKES